MCRRTPGREIRRVTISCPGGFALAVSFRGNESKAGRRAEGLVRACPVSIVYLDISENSVAIFFACKQCGKRFERPGPASGTLVFCVCGAGTLVPWESTLPPEETAAGDVASLGWAEAQSQAESQPSPDPARCFNHADTPRSHLCAACGEAFCGGCVVVFEGETLCGACKNFRLRARQRPPRLSVLSILAALLSLATGSVWLFVLLGALGSQARAPAVITLGVIGMVPQLAALLMAAWALRAVESDNQLSGRDWAITGLIGVLVSSVATGQMVLLVLQIVD